MSSGMFGFLKSGFNKIKQALGKTRSFLSQRLRSLFSKPLNEETFEQLEQILFEADLGSECAVAFVEHLRKELPRMKERDVGSILKLFHDHALSILRTAVPVES